MIEQDGIWTGIAGVGWSVEISTLMANVKSIADVRLPENQWHSIGDHGWAVVRDRDNDIEYWTTKVRDITYTIWND